MKKFLFLFAFLFFSFWGFGQSQLLIQNGPKGLHLVHKVAPKEGIYALGRMYAIHPREIAAYNNIDLNSGLSIGQSILIPLTETNFTQTASTGIPVYYVVGEKEGLYRVSLKNGNVLMADLRKWNDLSNDAIRSGQKLIVGFLAPSEGAPSSTAATESVLTAPAEEVAKPAQPAPAPVAPRPEKRVEAVAPPPPAPSPVRTVAFSDGNGGYFKSQFEQQARVGGGNKELTLASGIFKTTSGWQDAKYYALLDGVDPGTIVRVINPSNNKAIYAKVLGGMTGIRQNQGYDVRISSAAASVLEVKDSEKFTVKVSY